MTLANAAELMAAAVESGRAVPAFNVITLEHAEAIVAGATTARTGVLLQISENAVRYHGGALEPLAAACRELARTAPVAIGTHLDHVEDLALAGHAFEIADEFGIGSIMFDASRSDYEANVASTRTVAASAHARGLWVEAELGAVGGKDGAHAPGVRTDPTEAQKFVAATGVDALAVAVGSSHAMVERSAQLDVDLIRAITAVAGVPLVLHGSSGVSDEGIAEAIRAGIRKVNIGTALNVSWSESLRSAMAAEPSAVDPRRYYVAPRDEVATVVAHLCEVIAG